MSDRLFSQKYHLGHFPTPLEPMRRFSHYLGGPEIWIKRDDCTGLAGGGNKTRKLEYLISDALRTGADTLITTGALQSNHARQTAAAAAKVGLNCLLLLEDAVPFRAPYYHDMGNLLLDDLLSAQVQRLPRGSDLTKAALEAAAILRKAGKRPYTIPLGGSNGLGALAYVDGVGELTEQAKALAIEFDYVVVASGSGGTHAGILAGAAYFKQPWRTLGVSVSSQPPEQRHKIEAILSDLENYLPDRCTDLSVDVDAGQIGSGYGQPTRQAVAAIRLVAETEAILLDPVYTGKAMAGLMDFVQTQKLNMGKRILFWHTGGQAFCRLIRPTSFDHNHGRWFWY